MSAGSQLRNQNGKGTLRRLLLYSGTQDAFLKIQLKNDHTTSSFDFAKRLRKKLNSEFTGVEFSFNTGGIITAALNYGLASPMKMRKAQAFEVLQARDHFVNTMLDYIEIVTQYNKTQYSWLYVTGKGF